MSDKPLRRVSPCEHGVAHGVEALQEGCEFNTPECRNTKGVKRPHVVTAAKYPVVVRRKP